MENTIVEESFSTRSGDVIETYYTLFSKKIEYWNSQICNILKLDTTSNLYDLNRVLQNIPEDKLKKINSLLNFPSLLVGFYLISGTPDSNGIDLNRWGKIKDNKSIPKLGISWSSVLTYAFFLKSYKKDSK